MKKTPWFPGDVKPVRDGVYQRAYDDGKHVEYCLFKGGLWFTFGDTVDDASQSDMTSSFQDEIRWRGLAEKPE